MEKNEYERYKGEGFFEYDYFYSNPPCIKDIKDYYEYPGKGYNWQDKCKPDIYEGEKGINISLPDVESNSSFPEAEIEEADEWTSAYILKSYSIGVKNGYEQAKKDIEEELGVAVDSLKDILKLLGGNKKEDYYD